MEQRLFQLVAQIMRVPPGSVGIDASPDTIGSWDSLHHMRLLLAVEEAFGVSFQEGEIVAMTDLRSIVARLNAHGVA